MPRLFALLLLFCLLEGRLQAQSCFCGHREKRSCHEQGEQGCEGMHRLNIFDVSFAEVLWSDFFARDSWIFVAISPREDVPSLVPPNIARPPLFVLYRQLLI